MSNCVIGGGSGLTQRQYPASEAIVCKLRVGSKSDLQSAPGTGHGNAVLLNMKKPDLGAHEELPGGARELNGHGRHANTPYTGE